MSVFGFKMDEPQSAPKRPWIVIVSVLIVITLGAFTLARSLQPAADFPGDGNGQVTITIEPGDTLREIGQNLYTNGVIAGLEAWIAVVNSDERATSIAPGEYNLRSEMSSRAALDLLLDPLSRAVKRLTIPEGLRVTEILDLAAKVSGIEKSDFLEVLKDPESYGLPTIANGNPEGFLFPATYEIPKDSSAASILSQMTARWFASYDSLELARRSAAAGHTVLEIVTIASILEVEGAPVDYAKVARVIENRLKIGMRLQLDSTVNYALGLDELNLTQSQLDTKSPYNTYTSDGLPPGPIGNPGEAALEAALEPAPGTWLFFVTTNIETQKTEFATTYEEFLVLKRKYLDSVN
jgi:UPF0755 protein